MAPAQLQTTSKDHKDRLVSPIQFARHLLFSRHSIHYNPIWAFLAILQNFIVFEFLYLHKLRKTSSYLIFIFDLSTLLRTYPKQDIFCR